MQFWIPIYHDIKVLLGRQAVVLRKLTRMEIKMGKATDQLNTLSAKVDDLTSDVRAALETIGNDELSPEAQAALDGILAKVDAFDAEVGDRDGSDTPVEPTPDEPAPVDPFGNEDTQNLR